MFRLNWLHWSSLTVLIGLLIGLVGCNSEVALIPATGVVTLDGKPVEGANVSFAPAEEGASIATGKTDASGRFTLSTPGRGEGAAEGSYKVAIVKTASVAGASFEDPRGSGEELSPEQMKQMMEMAKGVPPISSLIPKIYASTQTSGFKAEVTASGENDFTFEMTK